MRIGDGVSGPLTCGCNCGDIGEMGIPEDLFKGAASRIPVVRHQSEFAFSFRALTNAPVAVVARNV
jgi:hypothetical protein